jgi:site-specific recombinase XerD
MNTLTLTKNEILNPQVNFEYFTDFARNFVTKIESGEILTKKKVRFSKDTIRQYNVSIDHFEEFEKKLDSKIRVHEINKRLLEAFEKYLYNNGLLFNSVYLYISKIKALGNILYDSDVVLKPLKFDTPKKITTQVYLSESELSAMRNCNKLTPSEKKVLDVFLIQCFTGLRYSTLIQFLSNPIAYLQQNGDKTFISIVSKKTVEESCIPLSKIVFEILNKYEFKFDLKSEEYVNRTIKKIAGKAGITNPIAIQVTRNSKTETVIVPKNKLIKTHTCRRVFITLAKMYINDNEAIRTMSGHATEAQMNLYSRASKLEKVNNIFDNQFFNLTI